MEIVQSKLLSQLQGIRHGFFLPGKSGKKRNNYSFKQGVQKEVLTARRKACEQLGIQAEFLTHVYQEHGTEIWVVNLTHRGSGALTGEGQVGVGDAMMTCERDIPLAILVADCIPLIFADRSERFVTIAHAGWRGTNGDIAGKTVRRIQKEYSISAKEIVVWAGPGISRCCFEVGTEVWNTIEQNWGQYSECFFPDSMKIDLKQLNRLQLVQSGILNENIDISKDCTCCDERYFSFRRDGAGSGHNLAVVQLDGPVRGSNG